MTVERRKENKPYCTASVQSAVADNGEEEETGKEII